MAGSINKVILLGRLGGDPEIRLTQDGNKIARFSIATSESWKDKNTNEKKEKTEWHRIVIFSPGLSNIAEKYLKKGSRVYIEGKMQYGKYTDQTGMEKQTSEVALDGYNSNLTMLDTRSDGQSNLSSPSLDNSVSEKNVTSDFDNIDIEDEVPF
tara:strand:+ start:458 stop:919 length:462 start_codon:yes stop_codon:yes gene_type:complete